jgi:polygalacturonase
MKSSCLILILVFLFFFVPSSNSIDAQTNLIQYTKTPGAVASSIYTITVNGQSVFVEKYKGINYARFAFTGAAQIVVSGSSGAITPKSYNISSTNSGNSMSFTLSKPMKIVINGSEKLFIFADPPETNVPQLNTSGVVNILSYVPNANGTTRQTTQIQKAIDETSALNGGQGGTLYFPNGKYLTGTLNIKSNVTIYLESGTIIQGTDTIDDHPPIRGVTTGGSSYPRRALLSPDKSHNIKIVGRGVIDANGKVLRTKFGNTDGRLFLLQPLEVDTMLVDGPVLRDSGEWTVVPVGSNNVTIRNTKVLADTSITNVDGINADTSTNITIDDNFVYSQDDCFSIKTFGWYHIVKPTNNIVIKNNVCARGLAGVKIGTESNALLSNVRVENNDFLDNLSGFNIATKDGGTYQDLVFINNRTENISSKLFIINSYYNNGGTGNIKNVTISDHVAYTADPSNVSGLDSTHKVSGVHFNNIRIGGTLRTSLSDAQITVGSFAEDVTFTTNGSLTNTPVPSSTNTFTPTPTTKPSNTVTNTATVTISPTPTPLPGDANNDRVVDGIDFVVWLANYGKTIQGGSGVGDFNKDGKVDGIDYAIWVGNYGRRG